MWPNLTTPEVLTTGKEGRSNIILHTYGSNRDSIRKAIRAPHRTNGRKRSQRKGTTQWTLLPDGSKPAPPTCIHPLMTRNAKSYERRDGASGAGNKGISVDTVLKNLLKQGGIHRTRIQGTKRYRPQPPNRPQNRRTRSWPKRKRQLRTSSDSSLMPRMT